MTDHSRRSAALPGRHTGLRRRSATVEYDGLNFAGAVVAAEGGGLVVFVGLKAGDALLESGKFDHHEAREFFRSIHDLEAAPRAKTLPPYLARMPGTRSVYFLYSVGLLIFERATQ
jgi:hypothetical protein